MACFYDPTLAEDEQLQPSLLATYLHRFQALQYLKIETHRTDDDLTLASFIASCTTLQTLVIEHASEPEPNEPEYSESDSEDDQFAIDRSYDRYLTNTVAYLPSLVDQGIPNLTSLSHLALIRIDLGKVTPQQPALHNLRSLAFLLCGIGKDILSWILQDCKK